MYESTLLPAKELKIMPSHTLQSIEVATSLLMDELRKLFTEMLEGERGENVHTTLADHIIISKP